ncbi:class I adenylate-forming enzyme family protein [Sphingomonas crocodyli]|uniref:Long-chain fatty acid--CoA ligase n=1 Tax=Sphingomonas crocodyli TaxID=1979270 RepID=A0A437M7W6_9SPHN|nr:class I adenylate-forming enzyme family protein [Sphingomonas crocodyli]RVT93749.1 long-chain fatty acid--CoA ligase [Sphingomonas crocodyli]
MTKLADMIRDVAAIDPDAPELEYEKTWYSWRDLTDLSAAIDAKLTEAGLGEGVRVGCLLRNRPEFVSTLIALFTTGRCLATLNASAPADKLANDVEKVAAPVILALDEDWERPGVLDAAKAAGSLGLAFDGKSVRVVCEAKAGATFNHDAPGIAIEMLSSGTTGTPKRIPLAARNFEKALMSAAAYEKGRDQDAPMKLRSGVQVVTAPLAHIAGITGIMNPVLAGRKICLIDKFSVEAFRDAVVRHRPKVAGAPPSALRMILDADIPKEDLSSLVAYRTGTAPLDPDLADAFYKKYGIPVLQNYGATEFAGGAAGWTLQDFKDHWETGKRGSVGRLNPGAEARTVDPENGDVLEYGKEGLLEIRAPNIGNGKDWVRTTDIAVVDEDRFLWIKGRYDNAIIRGGFKILPDDVIRAMEQHPSVREATVAGMPDRRLGEVPVAAFIRRADTQAPTQEEFVAFLRERLMPYQVPVKIVEMADFPRTPSLKVSLPALKALFEAEMATN